MYIQILLFACVVLACRTQFLEVYSEVALKLLIGGVIPDVLGEVPNAKITVIYPNGKEVNFGEELTPTEVIPQPQVRWEAQPNELYTLSMVDPDIPTRANRTNESINHWLVINIKGNDLNTGQTLVQYGGAQPRRTHGFHRYVFFIFRQCGPITVNEPNLANRTNFSIRDFARKYCLGPPIAGNYFHARWDPSIPADLN